MVVPSIHYQIVIAHFWGLTMERSINKNCSIFGKAIIISLMENGEYTGGHYFGRLRSPCGEGEYVRIGTSKTLDNVPVVEWTGSYHEGEYWECDDCFLDDGEKG
jgi:hypothetical protein